MLTSASPASNDYGIAILLGGEGRRLGRVDKAGLTFGKVTLLDRLLAIVTPLTSNVSLITKHPEKYQHYQLPVYPDVYSVQSPLVGIHSALFHSRARYELVLAVDQPCLKTDFLRFLLDHRYQADIVIPCWCGKWEPLSAVYSCDLVGKVQQLVLADKCRPLEILAHASYVTVTEKELTAFGDLDDLFTNINTPAELDRMNKFTSLHMHKG